MLSNNHFIMLRSLNKEPFVVYDPVLWKKRKNKWLHSIEKIDEAYDLCAELEEMGFVFRRDKTCSKCHKDHDNLEKHGDFYFSGKRDVEFVLTRKGDIFINKINHFKQIKILPKENIPVSIITKICYKISKYLHAL